MLVLLEREKDRRGNILYKKPIHQILVYHLYFQKFNATNSYYTQEWIFMNMSMSLS